MGYSIFNRQVFKPTIANHKITSQNPAVYAPKLPYFWPVSMALSLPKPQGNEHNVICWFRLSLLYLETDLSWLVNNYRLFTVYIIQYYDYFWVALIKNQSFKFDFKPLEAHLSMIKIHKPAVRRFFFSLNKIITVR